jgi:divalent metal cation (Fe/Co/Zn/Cd) transporter
MSTSNPTTTSCTKTACCDAPASSQRDAAWLRAARMARGLSWLSLGWMTVEGSLGVYAGGRAGSIALIGWALSSVVEGLASAIVIWRFTGSRTHSETSERIAQKAVAVSFWLLAPYVAVESVRALAGHHEAQRSVVGMALTAVSLVAMPLLGVAKRRLGVRLGSAATAGEGGQNLLCAYLAAAVLVGLAGNALFGWWWLDPAIGLLIAGQAVREGRDAWRGKDCC